MTTKVILIDDIRDLPADLICRNYYAAELMLKSIWVADWEMLLDHDLGEEQTGYDVIKYAISVNNLPKRVFIVSSNPVGRDNIGHALMATKEYRKKSPMEFIRIENE